MPENRTRLPLPLAGISRVTAAADQPQGTTEQALNVRAVDSVTGRVRLSQRPGMSEYVAGPVVGGKIDEVVAVAYDETRVRYTQNADNLPVVWGNTSPDGVACVAIDTDRQGNVYALSAEGKVSRYNSSGELVDSFQVSVPRTGSNVHSVLDRLVVDEFDRVYVATYYQPSGTGWAFTVFQYQLEEAPDGSDQFVKQWEVSDAYAGLANSANSRIVDFDVRAGVLALLYRQYDAVEADQTWYMASVFSLYTPLPLAAWEEAAPYATARVRLGDTGDLYVTFPKSSLRAPAVTAGYGPSVIDYWIHDEFQSRRRLHAFYVPDLHQGLDDQARVDATEDHRWVGTTATADDFPAFPQQIPGYDPTSDLASPLVPYDNNLRRHFVSYTETQTTFADGEYPLRPPKWRYNSIGSKAGLEFDSTEAAEVEYTGGNNPVTGNALWQEPSTAINAAAFKRHRDGGYGAGLYPLDGNSVAPFNKQYNPVIPVWDVDHYNGGTETALPQNGYTFTVALELPDSNAPQVVMSSGDNTSAPNGTLKWALLYNVGWTGSGLSSGATHNHKLTFYYEQKGTGNFGFELTSGQWGYGPNQTARSGRPFVVFTFVHAGTQGIKTGVGSTSVPARTNHCCAYVNGVPFGPFTLNGHSNNANYVHLGGVHMHNQDGSTIRPPWSAISSLANIEQFGGKVGAYATVLHPTDASVDSGANGLDTVTGMASGYGAVQPVDNSTLTAPAAAAQCGTLDPAGWTGDWATRLTYTRSATTVERLEGMLAHYYGSSDVLPDPGSPAQDGTTLLWDAHPFGGERYPVGEGFGFIGLEPGESNATESSRAGVAKYSGANGAMVWAMNAPGVGSGLAVAPKGRIIAAGEGEKDSSVFARALIDKGVTFSAGESEGAWVASGDTLTANPLAVEADVSGNAYVALRTDTDSDSSNRRVVVLSNDSGKELARAELTGGKQLVRGLALPQPPLPNYYNDDIDTPEFLYVASNAGSSFENAVVTKFRLVDQRQVLEDSASLRRHRLVVVGNGDVKLVDQAGISDVTGGTGALLTSSPYVQGVQLFGEVFLTDGEKIVVLNPRTGELKDYAPTDGGEAPQRCRILTAWRGRLILARAADYPYEITASELGNPYGMNIYPAALSSGQAWRGTAAGVGRAPDVVNSFVPLNDDLAIIGGDHSMHILRGDPAAGGEIDALSDSMGLAFGNAWCRGPAGEVYAFTSRGGVIAIAGGAQIQRLTLNRIERTLQAVDLTLFKIRMAWDYRNEGLIVVPVPYVRTGEKHRGWFWQAQTGGWFEDEWSETDVQPSALTVFDGDDPDDRLVLVGCEDGHLRYIDVDAKSDDGRRIRSELRIGPLIPGGESYRYRFMQPQIVLAHDQGGVAYELQASDTADRPGRVWASGRVEAGRSAYLPVRTSGAAVWMTLRNDNVDERWSLEDATMGVARAGRARSR
jgi:hypothetical protein